MNKNSIWYCADFETTSKKQYDIEGCTRVYLWKMICGVNNKEYLGLSIESFFDEISNLQDKHPTIYFHNLNFDGEFILWYLMNNEFVYDEKVSKINSYNTIIDESNSIYKIEVRLKTGIYVTFLCSYKLFPKSIKEIGKLVGIEKLNETHDYNEIKNYNSVDDLTEEELMYITNDVKIMVELIKFLRKNNISAITMSSSAYKNWRSDKNKYFLSKNKMIKDNNEEIVEIVRKSYRGGITMINPKYVGVDIKDSMSFDVNSLYPSVMYDNPMPIGMGKIYNSIEECKKDHRYLYIVVLVITKVKVKQGYHAFYGNNGFSFQRKYTYSNELENQVLYLWGKEYELFKLVYEGNMYISKVVGWKSQQNVFKEYIDRWYDIKEHSNGNETLRSLAKLMLNSLYGKFGMNDNRVSKIPVGEDDDNIIYRTIDTPSIYYYKEVASYITSMARCKLVTFLEMCGEDFIYCDTDSIYMKGKTPPDFLAPFIHPTKIGYWKYEGHYTHFRGWKAKCYIKENEDGSLKRSIAGCPKETAEQFNFDNFYPDTELKDAKRVKKKVKGGIIIDNTSFKIHL